MVCTLYFLYKILNTYKLFKLHYLVDVCLFFIFYRIFMMITSNGIAFPLHTAPKNAKTV